MLSGRRMSRGTCVALGLHYCGATVHSAAARRRLTPRHPVARAAHASLDGWWVMEWSGVGMGGVAVIGVQFKRKKAAGNHHRKWPERHPLLCTFSAHAVAIFVPSTFLFFLLGFLAPPPSSSTLLLLLSHSFSTFYSLQS